MITIFLFFLLAAIATVTATATTSATVTAAEPERITVKTLVNQLMFHERNDTNDYSKFKNLMNYYHLINMHSSVLKNLKSDIFFNDDDFKDIFRIKIKNVNSKLQMMFDFETKNFFYNSIDNNIDVRVKELYQKLSNMDLLSKKLPQPQINFYNYPYHLNKTVIADFISILNMTEDYNSFMNCKDSSPPQLPSMDGFITILSNRIKIHLNEFESIYIE